MTSRFRRLISRFRTRHGLASSIFFRSFQQDAGGLGETTVTFWTQYSGSSRTTRNGTGYRRVSPLHKPATHATPHGENRAFWRKRSICSTPGVNEVDMEWLAPAAGSEPCQLDTDRSLKAEPLPSPAPDRKTTWRSLWPHYADRGRSHRLCRRDSP